MREIDIHVLGRILATCFKSLKMFILFNQVILFTVIVLEEIILYFHKYLFRKIFFAVFFRIMRNNTELVKLIMLKLCVEYEVAIKN